MNTNRSRMLALTGAGSTLALVAAGLIAPQAQAAATTAAAAPAAAAPAVATGPAKLRLQAGEWTPTAQNGPAVKKARTASTLKADQKGLHIVQFNGPVQTQWTAAVQNLGVTLLNYVPDNAFTARLTPKQAAAIRKLDSVAWVGRLQGDWKLTNSARKAMDKVEKFNPSAKKTADNSDAAMYALSAAPDAANGFVDVVKATGASIYQSGDGTVVVLATAAQIDALAASDSVQTIDVFNAPKAFNDVEQGQIMAGNTANTRGFDGRTQIGAVMDTGFAYGSMKRSHPGIAPERIVAIRDYVGGGQSGCYTTEADGSQDVNSGHGTHVAVTTMGAGDANGLGKAAANKARLVFQSAEDYIRTEGLCGLQVPSQYALIGLADPGSMIGHSVGLGARVSNNSWGSNDAGAYSNTSADIDKAVQGARSMTVVFAAGNEGTDANADGVIDLGAVGSPATAKNVIAVGASESNRPDWVCDASLTYETLGAEGRTWANKSCKDLSGNLGTLPSWGDWWAARYRAEPYKSDSQANSAEQMAAFSSRGPTQDGRIKPEIVAPGSWTVSGYSPMFQQGYGGTVNPLIKEYQFDGYGLPINKDYKYLSGTSMAAPAVASAALVVRDAIKQRYNIDASAALVKTALINSAVDLKDEDNDGVEDNKFPIPNAHEGWGRVNLDNATRGTATYVDEATPLTTGAVSTTTFTVDGTKPFKISMAWTDAPALPTATKTLVNDLDLEVISPTGVRYRGNDFVAGWSKPSSSKLDTVNNLENVYVEKPTAGQWTVNVRAGSVPTGSQPFAMTVDGATEQMPLATAPVIAEIGYNPFSVGVPYRNQIVATDPAKGALTYSAEGLPPGVTIDAKTGVMSGTPTATLPTGVVFVTVTSSTGTSTRRDIPFNWTSVDPRNIAPKVQTVPATWAVGEDIYLDYNKFIKDTDGDPLTYTSAALPEGLSLDAKTGVLTGRIMAPTTTMSFQVQVSDGSDTRSFRTTYAVVDTPIAGERIVNGGFESGNLGWIGPDVSLGTTNPVAHGGAYVGRLGGNGYTSSDKIAQRIVVRPDSTTFTGSLWSVVVTADKSKTAVDTMKLNVVDQQGKVLETLTTWSNLSAGKKWVETKYDLKRYLGKTIYLEFVSSENASGATNFYLDDVSFQTT